LRLNAIEDFNMHGSISRLKVIAAFVAVTFTWQLAVAAEAVPGDANRPETKDANKAADMPDLSKRIVYSVDGMSRVAVTRDLVYKREGDTKLLMNVYSPRNIARNANLPAVLFVHGGPIPVDMMPPKEWGAYQSYGELVAASGFVGITFNHRLQSQNDYSRSQSDVAAANEYVRSHAKELHVDANRIALWIYSGGGTNLSWVLRDRPAGLRCALAFYSLLDLRPFLPPNADANLTAVVERLSAAAQIKEYGAGLPIFIARAGLDAPPLNQGIDRFVSDALAANLDIEIMNHSHGHHSFDVLDDDDRSREIIARAIAFLQTHLRSQ
jgi:acetyl esterase/lipase